MTARSRKEVPDYVLCVLHTHKDRAHETLCGEPSDAGSVAFVNLAHAYATRAAKGRCVVCKACADEACRMLHDESV